MIDTLVMLMPYSLIMLHLWLGVAMAWRARRSGIKPWWAHGLLMFSLALQSAIILRPLGRAETDTLGLWFLGTAYVVMISIPIVLLMLGSRAIGKDAVSPADLAFTRSGTANAVGEHSIDVAATTSGSRRAALIALFVFITLVATSLLGVLLQPCAPGDVLLQRSGCLQTTDLGERVTRLTASPDGSLLASQPYTDDRVLLWERSTGRIRHEFRLETRAYSVVFARDSSALAVSTATGAVIIWETATGQLRGQIEAEKPSSDIALSSDGQLLAVGTARGLKLWRWDGQQFLAEPFAAGENQQLSALAVSEDSEFVAIAAVRPEGGIRITVWERGTSQKVSEILEGPVGHLQFSPDSRLLIAGGAYFSERAMVRVWEAATGQLVQTFAVDDTGVSSLAVSPDSGLVAASTFDDRLYVWSLTPDAQRRVFLPGSSARSMAFVDDSTVALGLYPNVVRLWRVR